MIDPELRRFIEGQRVARFTSVDEKGRPHVVPICFALVGENIYSVLDAKPKRVEVMRLRRVRNLLANPDVQVLLDRYDEDWSLLRYVQLRGKASIITPDGTEHAAALDALRARYPQYRAMDLEDAPVIRVAVEGCVAWQAARA
jgi:coenzyme F420-0:L-glutamate ligase/coenzyme F420-1:gamma-L-glutamate ligase